MSKNKEKQNQRFDFINLDSTSNSKLDAKNYNTISYSPQKSIPLYQKYNRKKINIPQPDEISKKSIISRNEEQQKQITKTLDEYQSEIQQLRRQLKRLSQQHFYQKGKLQSQIQYQICLLNQSKQNYFKLEFSNKQIQRQNNTLNKQIEQYRFRDTQESAWRNTRLQQAEQKIRDISEKCKQSQQIIVILKNEISSNKTRYDSELQRLNKIIERYEQKLKEEKVLQNINKELRLRLEQNEINKGRIQYELRQNLDIQKKKNVLLTEQLQNIKLECSKLRKDLTNLNMQRNSIENNYFQDINRLEQQLGYTHAQIQKIKKKHILQIKNIQNQYQKLRQQNQQLNLINSNKDKIIHQTKNNLQYNLQSTQNQYIRQIQKFQTQKIAIANQLQSLHLQYQNLNNQYHYLKSNHYQINLQIQNLKLQNAQLQKLLTQFRHKDYFLSQKLQSAHIRINQKQVNHIQTNNQFHKFNKQKQLAYQQKQHLRKQNELLKEQKVKLLNQCQNLDANYFNLYRRGLNNNKKTIVPPIKIQQERFNNLNMDINRLKINRGSLSVRKHGESLNDSILQRCKWVSYK